MGMKTVSDHFLPFACAAARILCIIFSTSGCGSGEGVGNPCESERSYGPMKMPSVCARAILILFSDSDSSEEKDKRTEAVDGEDLLEVGISVAGLDLNQHHHGVIRAVEIVRGGDPRTPCEVCKWVPKPSCPRWRKACCGDDGFGLRAVRYLDRVESGHLNFG